MTFAGNKVGSFLNSGTFVKKSGTGTSTLEVPFTTTGFVHVEPGVMLKATAGYTQNGGTTYLENGDLFATDHVTMVVNGGLVAGVGTITGTVNFNGGRIAPGLLTPGSPLGTLTITRGNLITANPPASDPQPVLAIQLGGRTQGGSALLGDYDLRGFDLIRVENGGVDLGQVVLGGKLEVSFAGGFGSDVTLNDKFYILVADGPVTGNFSNLYASGPDLRVAVTGGTGSFRVTHGTSSGVYQSDPSGTYGYVLLDNYEVPEPSAAVLAVSGLSFVLLRRRAHRVQA